MDTKGMVYTIGSVLVLGVFVLLLARWLFLDKTRKNHLKNVLRQVPYLLGRYTV